MFNLSYSEFMQTPPEIFIKDYQIIQIEQDAEEFFAKQLPTAPPKR